MKSEQLFFRQPETLSKAVRLVRQLESSRLASSQQKPKVQLNAIGDVNGESEIQELKNLITQLNSRLDKLEKQPVRRQRDRSNVKCYSCSRYGHFLEIIQTKSQKNRECSQGPASTPKQPEGPW